MPNTPRRLQRQQQQQQRRQTQQPPPPVDAPPLPATPKSLPELKQLLQLYGPFLSAENRALVSELVARLEDGGDPGGLLELAGRLQQAVRRQQGE